MIARLLANLTLLGSLALPLAAVVPTAGRAKAEKAARAEERVTRENYAAVRVGMTLAEVEAILGPGRERFSTKNVVLVEWRARGIVRPTRVTLSFLKGEVVGKAVTGK